MIGYVCCDLGDRNNFPVIGTLPKDIGEARLSVGGHYIPIWKVKFNAPEGFEFPPTEKLCDPGFPQNFFPHIREEGIDVDGYVDEMGGTLVIAATKNNPYARVSYKKLAFMRHGRTEELY